MKYLVAVVFALMVTFLFAQHSLVLGQTPCTQAYPLATGETAPCSGVVWPSLWSVQCVEMRDVQLPQCKANLEFYEKRTTACEKHTTALDSLCTDKLDALRKIAEDAAGITQPWYERPLFVAVLSFTVGAAATSAAVYLAK